MFADIREFVALNESFHTSMLAAQITGQPSSDVGHSTDLKFPDTTVHPGAYDKNACWGFGGVPSW